MRHPERDTFAEARAALALRLLGPAEPPAQERFAAAVRALCASARAHRSRTARRRAAELPGQRREDPAEPSGAARTPASGTAVPPRGAATTGAVTPPPSGRPR